MSESYRYNIVTDYTTATSGAAVLSPTPYWVILVIPLGKPISFDRATHSSPAGVDPFSGGRLRGKPILIISDCINLTITSSKTAHQLGLNATLIQGKINYLTQVLPGDWVMSWIVNGEKALRDLVKLLQKPDPKKPANEFNSGLKFIGRVESLRKSMSLDKESGVKRTRYSLVAIGFKEFTAQIFYDQALATADKSLQAGLPWLVRAGFEISKLFENLKGWETNADNINIILDVMLTAFIGTGFRKGLNPEPTIANAAVAGGVGISDYYDEPPRAYLVPSIVGQYLGIQSKSKTSGFHSYADLLMVVMGVQKYGSSAISSEVSDGGGEQLFPQRDMNLSTPTFSRCFCPDPLYGTFPAVAVDISNKPLWNVLEQFLNPTVNEMYTCLKPGPDGRIRPALIVRQIPFTSDAFNPKGTELQETNANWGSSAMTQSTQVQTTGPSTNYTLIDDKIRFTPYSSLPRWVLHPAMVTDVDIGRSDATRFNFIRLVGFDPTTSKPVSIPYQLVNNPPLRDDLDIQRSGVRSFSANIACHVRDQVGAVTTKWTRLIADRAMLSHLTLNGTIVSIGIFSPLHIGENVEFDNVIYHLESITHTCSMETNGGRRSFNSVLSVSNGVLEGTHTIDKVTCPKYAGFEGADLRFFDPMTSVIDGLPAWGSDEKDSGASLQDQDLDSAETPLSPEVQAGLDTQFNFNRLSPIDKTPNESIEVDFGKKKKR